MRIYTITPIGRKIARSVYNSDEIGFKIIAFLDKVGSSTVEQIADYCGAGVGETASILGRLRRKRIVNEVMEVSP